MRDSREFDGEPSDFVNYLIQVFTRRSYDLSAEVQIKLMQPRHGLATRRAVAGRIRLAKEFPVTIGKRAALHFVQDK